MSEDKKANRKQAAADMADGADFEVTSFGRRRRRKNKVLTVLAWVAVTIAVPFAYVAKRIRRKRAASPPP